MDEHGQAGRDLKAKVKLEFCFCEMSGGNAGHFFEEPHKIEYVIVSEFLCHLLDSLSV